MSERELNRRDFIRTGAQAGAALVIAVSLPGADALAGVTTGAGGATDDVASLKANAWIQVDADGSVSVVVDKHEMGQGVLTTFRMIVADELEVELARVNLLPVPEDPAAWEANGGRFIFTGGSTSTRTSWEPLRMGAAAGREMLRSAAAARLGVPVDACVARAGAIVHEQSGRRLSYAELVDDAARLPVPPKPALKPNSAFKIIGRDAARVEGPEKVRGTAVFGYDVELPDMLIASVERPPAFGAVLKTVNDVAARRVAGVVDVIRIPQGVAVVARNTWAAFKGRQALRLDWDTTPATGLSSDALWTELATLCKQPGKVTRNVGDANAALARAARVVQAEYFAPYMDHIPMEPMNATALVRPDGVEVWVPTQSASASQQAAAGVAGVKPAAVKVHSLLLGGGFGRRFAADDVVIAVEVAKRVPGKPVKVVWTREDSVRNGAYRPLTYHSFRGGLDAAGNPVALLHRIGGVSDSGTVGNGEENPYAFPNHRAEQHLKQTAVPTGPWRSVSFTHMGWVTDGFMDELAVAARKDPYQFKRAALAHNPKLLACIDLAAQKAGWGKPLPAGHARGIAASSSFNSHAAEVADVSISPDGEVKVHRVVVAAHVGTVVNPVTLAAQVESAVTLALGFTLRHGITVVDGAVQESNFHDYPVMRLDEMPAIEFYPVPSEEPPTGIGEPPVPPLPPAVTNAIFAATGKRIRRLPIDPKALRA
jgi:isoquinoline 1-oxidoreductase beta subunit